MKLVKVLSIAVVFVLPSAPETIEPWREELYRNWKALPEPPVTPYDGPFGGEARAFVGDIDWKHPDPQVVANWRAKQDYRRTATHGIYDPAKDPRPINTDFEEAILEDWRRMGYNCAYKGSSFTFMVGEFLKSRGFLGAIDQTLWGANGPPPLQFDGQEGRRQREACGSFFDPVNFEAGVQAIFGMGHFYGRHLFTVKDHRLTCSWDEVGMRTRAQMDYRPPMREEFRRFLRDVWFGDETPDRDTNGDGRTYNTFTGEKLTRWEDVEPLHVSLDWTMPGRAPDGTATFSAMPDVDMAIFREPARYKLLVDFHRYFTFEFFRRINEEATRRMNAAGTPGRITCYPFVQHFIIWPGMNQRHGNSFYWYHRLSPVVNVEHCWPDAPVMNLNYAITDPLAPRFRNLVMGWTWFYFGKEGSEMYNGPHDLDRALARMMGHVVDGTHHWLYSPRYRGRDQSQRLQIAYWQNFFKLHYPGFLSRSAPPRPQIALLMPDWTGYFYRAFQYPKQDWGWTAEAFQNLQYPFAVVTEEDLELNPAALDGFKVLYVIGAEWTTSTIRRRIEAFLARGGYLCVNADSLTLDLTTGRRTPVLEKVCGVRLRCKHKNAFYPSTQTAEEAVWALQFDRPDSPLKVQGHRVHDLEDPRAWAKLYARTEEKYLLGPDGKPQKAEDGVPLRDPSWKMIRDENGRLVRDESVWKQLDEAMARMPREVHGLAQAALDMRNPPRVRYDARLTECGPAVQWGEIVEAEPLGEARPIAWWGDRVVAIETERTVWLGTREGMNLHAISSRMEATRTTEPCNPFPAEIPETYEAHRPYAEVLGYAARKAGVVRPVTLTRGGKLPMNLEVLPRVAADGTLMTVVINHDPTEDTYEVTVGSAFVKDGAEAWDLLENRLIEANTDGQFRLSVPSWGVQVFLVGLPKALAPLKEAQTRLRQKDLSVPQYFRDRPYLNEYEYGTPVPPIESSKGSP